MRTVRTIAVLAVALGLVGAPLPADAQAALQLQTDYPAVLVEAGESASFNIDVVTSSPRRVDLDVAEAPDGWEAILRGGGFVVRGVFGDPDAPPQVELEVQVPPDAESGDHEVVLEGTSGGATDTLVLTLTVAEEAGGTVDLSAEFPEQRGSSSDTFTFSLTLQNNTPEETAFELSATGPTGWSVQARPTQETQAATVTVEGGGEANIDVEASPPGNVAAGEYPVQVEASSGAEKTARTELTVQITGSRELNFTTVDERLNRSGTAGAATEVTVVVRNTGSAPLQGISLSASPPSEWEVSFEPETIDVVQPGETGQATARVTPAGNAVAGDYTISFTATGAEGGDGSFDLRFTVETSRFWLVVGLLLIVGALLALRWVFGHYGRR